MLPQRKESIPSGATTPQRLGRGDYVLRGMRLDIPTSTPWCRLEKGNIKYQRLGRKKK